MRAGQEYDSPQTGEEGLIPSFCFILNQIQKENELCTATTPKFLKMARNTIRRSTAVLMTSMNSICISLTIITEKTKTNAKFTSRIMKRLLAQMVECKMKILRLLVRVQHSLFFIFF
nr:MAG TPA: hypothetical protein [Caudoviricetes sp.]